MITASIFESDLLQLEAQLSCKIPESRKKQRLILLKKNAKKTIKHFVLLRGVSAPDDAVATAQTTVW